MPNPTEQVLRDQQVAWAKKNGVWFNSKGYTETLDANLKFQISAEAYSAFSVGLGKEIDPKQKYPKMQALHSSSALVVNVFDYWLRANNVSDIAKACGFSGSATSMRYEAKHPTPIGSVPHLDIEFRSKGSNILAIESKFNESYEYHDWREIKEKYVNPVVWAGLPNCYRLVEEIYHDDHTFWTYLDAPQLLKHILGLTNTYGKRKFTLLYLWYEIPSKESDDHKVEIKTFAEYVADDARFKSMTYQALFKRIEKIEGVSQVYLDYIRSRYFSGYKVQ